MRTKAWHDTLRQARAELKRRFPNGQGAYDTVHVYRWTHTKRTKRKYFVGTHFEWLNAE